jgi:hypothetical protein
MKYEFEDKDTWCMCSALSPAIRDAIKIYQEQDAGLPLMELEDVKGFSGEHHEGMGYTSRDAWNHILDEMIFTFDTLSKGDFYIDENTERVNNGLDLFAKHFKSLWT